MTKMVSMELSDDQSYDAPMPIQMDDKPEYPYGLAGCLTQDEAEKLGIDASEAVVGGVFHFEAIAKITSVTSTDREGGDGPMTRIEYQVTDMGILSGEDAPAAPPKRGLASIYKST